METLLISACFLGLNCKYNGGNNKLPDEVLRTLREKYHLVPVCPEMAGGLPAPREPSERRSGGVYARSGGDVTAAFEKGAATALRLAERFDCRLALLKERSPSCGSGTVYDGTFTGTVIPGDGCAVEKLRRLPVRFYGESEVEKLL